MVDLHQLLVPSQDPMIKRLLLTTSPKSSIARRLLSLPDIHIKALKDYIRISDHIVPKEP